MKSRFRFLAVAAFALVYTLGCKALNTPVKAYVITWMWNLPADATAGSTYQISQANVATPAGPCPAVTPANYVNTVATASNVGVAFWTAPASGGNVCAVVQEVTAGGQSSQPSDVSNIVLVPALPLAPGAPSGSSQQSAALTRPALSKPAPGSTMAKGIPMQLVGRLVQVS